MEVPVQLWISQCKRRIKLCKGCSGKLVYCGIITNTDFNTEYGEKKQPTSLHVQVSKNNQRSTIPLLQSCTQRMYKNQYLLRILFYQGPPVFLVVTTYMGQ